MGVDFIRKNVSDHRKKYAAMARLAGNDLLTVQTTSAKRVFRATTDPTEPLSVGECVVLRRDTGGAMVVSKDARVVAKIARSPRMLNKALDSQAGCATAIVHAVSADAKTADLKLEP